MRLAIATAALALGAGAGAVPVMTLPRPGFPGPGPKPTGPHRLVLVSSQEVGPSLGVHDESPRPLFRGVPCNSAAPTANRVFWVCGHDAATGRYLVAYTLRLHRIYAFDFANYAWPPRIKPGDKDFVYEQVVWAHEANGVLYVENAHSTYASSSYGRNAYVTAIDLKTRRKLWRSPALVANAATFLVTDHYLITGYGFTDEPDYLYLLDRRTGKVVDRLDLPTGPERITWQGRDIQVRTYDHVVVARLKGA